MPTNNNNRTNKSNLAVKDSTGKTYLVPYTPYETTVNMIKSYNPNFFNYLPV